MKKLIWAAVTVWAVLVAIVIGWKMSSGGGVCYTRIDNSRMEEIEVKDGGVIHFKGSLPFSYTLPCYDENGKEKELQFTAGKILREGAFLRLDKQPVRGVVSWSEVEYDELPALVQAKYEAPIQS